MGVLIVDDGEDTAAWASSSGRSKDTTTVHHSAGFSEPFITKIERHSA
jgi:hypothetical protein